MEEIFNFLKKKVTVYSEQDFPIKLHLLNIIHGPNFHFIFNQLKTLKINSDSVNPKLVITIK